MYLTTSRTTYFKSLNAFNQQKKTKTVFIIPIIEDCSKTFPEFVSPAFVGFEGGKFELFTSICINWALEFLGGYLYNKLLFDFLETVITFMSN